MSISSTHAEPKVIDPCLTKFGAHIMSSSHGLLTVDIADVLSFTSTDIRAAHHWSHLDTTKPQLTLQFPSEEASSTGQAFLFDGQATHAHQETSLSYSHGSLMKATER
jgi:hypothetical protein